MKRKIDYQEAGLQQHLGPLFEQGKEKDMVSVEKDQGIGPAKVTVDPVLFITAGKARFTLRSIQTGKRYTYMVTSSDKKWTPDSTHPTIYWVKLLVGSDNTSDYEYIGTIFPHTGLKTTPKSRMTMQSEPIKALKFVWDFLHAHKRLPTTLEMWHEGRCARCGRVLTVPESIESGFGPECRGKVGL